MFHFTCFNVEDPHDPSVGLINGELAIPGNLLRREVFDPVVTQVCPVCLEQKDTHSCGVSLGSRFDRGTDEEGRPEN
jgi:hypothetical protein